jgi:hypothetical protein
MFLVDCVVVGGLLQWARRIVSGMKKANCSNMCCARVEYVVWGRWCLPSLMVFF